MAAATLSLVTAFPDGVHVVWMTCSLENAWWMQTTPQIPAQGPLQPDQSHKRWPWNLAPAGLIYRYSVLEASLRNRPGSACKIDAYQYMSSDRANWQLFKAFTSAKDILETKQSWSEPSSLTYIVRDLEGEAIQALGHSLHITPRFFNFSYSRLKTSNPVDGHLMYSLQFMDRYSLGIKPAEAQRLDTSPQYRFRATSGGYHDHIWHVTCIRLIFVKKPEKNNFANIVQVDLGDNAIADGLVTLMLREEEQPLDEAGEYAGLARLLSNTIYLVTFMWTAFFNEADAHLQILSDKCVRDNPTPTEQLQYTRELHRLSPLWVQVRRRLIAAKDLCEYVCEHPFFADVNNSDIRPAVKSLLGNRLRVLDDQISRCNELAEQTNVLISLIFSIATLQDTKLAVEESRAANNVASSIRRVTMLTFIYLPLTLASSVFGMNVTLITGDMSDSPIWAYFILATSLMCATFGGLFIWSQSLARIERRAIKTAKAQHPV